MLNWPIKFKNCPLFFVIAALATMILGWFTRFSLPVAGEVSKALGEVIFLEGMIAFTWTIVHSRSAFLGGVVPVAEKLITHGPYRWVRHPLYLCMTVVLLGIGIALQSLWGIVSVFIIFFPVAIHRALLEEIALSEKFGCIWDEYAGKTKFLFPFFW